MFDREVTTTLDEGNAATPRLGVMHALYLNITYYWTRDITGGWLNALSYSI